MINLGRLVFMSNLKSFLTQGQRRVLAYIGEHISQYQQSPTAKEIAAGIGIQSRGVVYRYLLALKAAGYIDLIAGRHRNIVLLESPASEQGRYEKLVIQGTIAAGEPILAINEPVEWGNSMLAQDPHCYALRVRGDSMRDDGILDGDLVVCRRASQADNGTVVVALVDGDSATLKRIYHHGDEVELRPANAKHQPLRLPASRVMIQGVLTKVVRSYD